MLLLSTTLLAGLPLGVSAEWKNNTKGWWYTEGNSYATGWRLINSSWYYFDDNGYVEHNKIIGNYYLYSNGEGVALMDTKIHIKMPMDWARIDDNSYMHNNKTALLYGGEKIPGNDIDGAIDGFKSGLTKNSSNVISTKKNYNGYDANCYEYNMDTKQGIKKAYSVVFIKNNIYYAFVIASSDSDYEQDKKALEDLLNLSITL